MRDPANAFHLAIPCAELEQTASFYTQLGCSVARRYQDRITIDFFGDQLVCHLAPDDVAPEPKMYPRHFGITFRQRDDYENILLRARSRGIPFFRQPFVRFSGQPEQHTTFFLLDPSNNLLEFKFYEHLAMMI
ncbi:VOC family protein [Cyanobium sp. ATX 6A2]|uniref:VOC family protein n=1 Tax=Cyanobium sp. ATX 6A2 TaxID=2823700 RepID=UPI0037C015B7|nr:VOC family protein [Cyanobium sp. ATX 6A2]